MRAARFALGAAAITACDVGPTQDDPGHGPALHVLSMIPENAQGLDCDRSQADCAVPTNTPIRLEFDRPLWPSTAVRQSLSIFVKQGAAYSPFLAPEYDLLTRTVNFRMSGTLLPGVLYQMRLPIAKKATDAGFRAFDGAPLEDGPVLTSSSFFTADGPREMPSVQSFEEPTCPQIVELFRTTCASSCCHGGSLPAMGLALDSVDALTNTAILRVAHQTETGNALGTSFVDPVRFGVGMQRIDPGRSYASYVMYKILRAPENLQPCSEGSRFCQLPGANDCVPLSDNESERLAGWFVPGEPMPPSAPAAHWMGCDDLPPRAHLDCGDLRAFARWIDRGAVCP